MRICMYERMHVYFHLPQCISVHPCVHTHTHTHTHVGFLGASMHVCLGTCMQTHYFFPLAELIYASWQHSGKSNHISDKEPIKYYSFPLQGFYISTSFFFGSVCHISPHPTTTLITILIRRVASQDLHREAPTTSYKAALLS